ncbi:putative bifunctional inhibitor/plant lipid transfer protein/seed storage helical [Lupinus albus]|uniref:Putative bifunctional inhibitor/plant lipid transfer protein/seed storage helical n=1 Tax=Lupinus albus TaxID=3870 RepID=A0A6A4PE04_LUPAL|nr:putative bifunctional inhibitor/plant lipid transfer protein/seed storage helical [Lupinus albus]
MVMTGKHPRPPNGKCCALVRQANLACLCSYKSLLPSIGINPTNALALPAKCSLRTPPRC